MTSKNLIIGVRSALKSQSKVLADIGWTFHERGTIVAPTDLQGIMQLLKR